MVGVSKRCRGCGVRFRAWPYRAKTQICCDLRCLRRYRDKTSKGYRSVTTPYGQMFEHRWVMTQALGRRLRPDELVHHKNEKKRDNRRANLEITTHAKHSRLHNPAKYPTVKTCLQCGERFEPRPSARKRAKFCGVECQAAAACNQWDRCRAERCGRGRPLQRGFCPKHYVRWRKGGWRGVRREPKWLPTFGRCVSCGKWFHKPLQARGRVKTCSWACRGKAISATKRAA